MGEKFNHLTYTDRCTIEKMYNKGMPKKEIAKVIGCCIATIYNELKRGYYMHRDSDTWKDIKKYSAYKAQHDYDYKASAKGQPLKIGNNRALADYIEYKILIEKYSPDALLNELPKKPFCTTTLYSYIDKGVFLNITNKHLPEKSRRRRKYNKVKPIKAPPKGTSIEKRPKYILDRAEPGHWEMDLVIGKAKGKKQSLLTLTERMTRYELIFPLKDKTTKSVIHALDKLDKRTDFQKVFKTITVDNGSEFSAFEQMQYSKTGTQRTSIYYCHPYCSSERGTNERMNRMVRRFFPKGKSMGKVTIADCQQAAKWLNNYPRRSLGYKTPAQVFMEQFQPDEKTMDYFLNFT